MKMKQNEIQIFNFYILFIYLYVCMYSFLLLFFIPCIQMEPNPYETDVVPTDQMKKEKEKKKKKKEDKKKKDGFYYDNASLTKAVKQLRLSQPSQKTTNETSSLSEAVKQLRLSPMKTKNKTKNNDDDNMEDLTNRFETMLSDKTKPTTTTLSHDDEKEINKILSKYPPVSDDDDGDKTIQTILAKYPVQEDEDVDEKEEETNEKGKKLTFSEKALLFAPLISFFNTFLAAPSQGKIHPLPTKFKKTTN